MRLMSVQTIAEGLSDRFLLLLTAGELGQPATGRSSPRSSGATGCSAKPSGTCSTACRSLPPVSPSAPFGRVLGGCCRARGRLRVPRLIGRKSLVQASPGADRLRLHETMHAYVAAALEAEGATAVLRDRHLDYFAELAKFWEPKTLTSEFPSARRDLEPELDNLRVALHWSVESKQFGSGAGLLASLTAFLHDLGHHSEALAQCRPFLAAEIEPSLRADLLFLASRGARLKDPVMGRDLASELVSLGRSLGDKGMQARGLVRLAADQVDAKPQEALEAADEGTRLARESGQHVAEVLGLQAKGWALIRLGRPEEALAVGEEALRASESSGWATGGWYARTFISYASICTGRFAQALEEADLLAEPSGAL